MKNNLNAIDITKFFMALLVISIHIKIFPFYPDISHFFTNGIGRIAVPFFFICSGYFFTKRENFTSFSNLLKTEKRIFILFLGWTLIYIMLLFFTTHIHSESPFQNLIALLFRYLILDPYGHLWYLPALMFGILGTWLLFLFNLNKPMGGGIIAIILYIIGVFGDSYYNFAINNDIWAKIMNTYSIIFQTMRNGIFFGFPMVFLATIPNYFSHKNNRLFSLISFILISVEYLIIKEYHLGRDYNMFITLPFFTYFFFHWIKEIHIELKPSICKFFREYSMGIYFIHIAYIIYLPQNINNYFFVTLSSMITIWIIKEMKVPLLSYLLK